MTARISTSNPPGPSLLAQPNATSIAPSSGPSMPPELEQTLGIVSSHKSVLGYMLVSRTHPASIIRHAGVVFEGEQGKRYASAIARIVQSVQTGLEEIHGGGSDADDVRFMRIRTTRHEIMISPDQGYLLAVLRDPEA